jgi:hypothetical protein
MKISSKILLAASTAFYLSSHSAMTMDTDDDGHSLSKHPNSHPTAPADAIGDDGAGMRPSLTAMQFSDLVAMEKQLSSPGELEGRMRPSTLEEDMMFRARSKQADEALEAAQKAYFGHMENLVKVQQCVQSFYGVAVNPFASKRTQLEAIYYIAKNAYYGRMEMSEANVNRLLALVSKSPYSAEGTRNMAKVFWDANRPQTNSAAASHSASAGASSASSSMSSAFSTVSSSHGSPTAAEPGFGAAAAPASHSASASSASSSVSSAFSTASSSPDPKPSSPAVTGVPKGFKADEDAFDLLGLGDLSSAPGGPQVNRKVPEVPAPNNPGHTKDNK